jgi:hypothetical protein
VKEIEALFVQVLQVAREMGVLPLARPRSRSIEQLAKADRDWRTSKRVLINFGRCYQFSLIRFEGASILPDRSGLAV